MANPNLPINTKMNTYVGARYVPIFANPIEWSATAKYEPMTIVAYQGNSYTSRTYVPAGIVPTNLTYWAPTGNYNAQVEQYRQEVLQLEEDVQNLQELPELSPQNIKRKFIIIGDSYTAATGLTSWTETFQAHFPQSEFFINGKDGALFSIPTPAGKQNFNELLTELVNTAPSDITDILVVIGGNDAGQNNNNILAGMQAFNTTVKQNFPNAQVHLFCATILLGYANDQYYGKLHPYLCSQGTILGWRCFYNTYMPLHSVYLISTDKQHPNNSGQVMLGNVIYNQFIGGNALGNMGSVSTPSIGQIFITQWIAEDGVHMIVPEKVFNYTEPLAIGYGWVKIASVFDTYAFTANVNFSNNINVEIITSSGTFIEPCAFKLESDVLLTGPNSKMSIRLLNPYSGNGTTKNYQATQIIINKSYAIQSWLNI